MWKNVPLFPESASTFSDGVDLVYWFLVLISVVSTVLIAIVTVFLCAKYRKRPGGPKAQQIHGSMLLEVAWTAAPLVICLGAFVWGAVLYFRMITPPKNATDLYVVGKQWMWKMQHSTGQREINDLHIPVGEAVRLTMTSEDVLHAFYVPAFRTKADVVPGRITSLWFQPTKVGAYHLFCAEYCGTKHSQMVGTVYVMEQRDYELWLSGVGASEAPEITGQKLFEANRCDTCHKDAPDARGPLLVGVYGKEVQLKDGGKAIVDDSYIRESILKPMTKVVAGFDPVMPTFEGQLGEEQILQIIAYIKSLKATGAGAK